MGRTGRRPGPSRTREAILAAARRRFAADGFRGATIRSIAADAGVDPALVHHYFRRKRDLFAAVLEFPVAPDVVVAVIAAGPAQEVGARVVQTFLDVWDTAEHRERMQIVLRTAVVDEQAARMLREFVVDALLTPIAVRSGADQPALRATLVASQLVGFAFLRYVLRLEPLRSASHDQIVAAYGPTLQRYLTGDLSSDPAITRGFPTLGG